MNKPSTLLTPLYLACQHGSLDTIKILSSYGANFKLRDENGLNCLHAGSYKFTSLKFF